MTSSNRPRHSLALRVRIAAVSLLSLIVTAACSLLRSESTHPPAVMCYEPIIEITNTPTPIVTCYTAPSPLCYSPISTPTPPISPLPTPTSTPTPEARRLLMDELLVEGRFPQNVVRQLES